MILLAHILIALSSIVCASLAIFRPSRATLRTSYALVGATFASGFYLVWSAPAHMMEACTSGIIYLALVSVVLVIARRNVEAAKEIAK